MIKLAILTATRAEYGLMRQLIFRIKDDPDIELNLLVTGTHLSKSFGKTVDEIRNDEVPIAAEIPILEEINGEVDVPKTMGNAIINFSDFFKYKSFDFLLVDGDRYETLAVCIAAVNNNIPIIHCGGGATTEGANDEYWRHAITKLSYLHFPTMEIYRRRIIRMGEDPERVFTVGSLGIENIRIMKLGEKNEVETKIGMKLDSPYALVTFHPVTLENATSRDQTQNLLHACERTTDMKFIFTKANSDKDGHIINRLLEKYAENHKNNSVCVSSLGSYYYLTAMKYCEFVIGNSSSGLIETPSFGIPTINIGDRQKGREKAKSIVDCNPEVNDICRAIDMARSREFRTACKDVVNPNGDGKTSERIVAIIKDIVKNKKFSMEKKFFDGKYKLANTEN